MTLIVGCPPRRFKARSLTDGARGADWALVATRPVTMRAPVILLLIAFAGSAFAQSAGAPASSGAPAASAAPAAASPPAAAPAPATSGRSTTPGRRQPTQAAAPTKEQTLDQQAKKARDEQEKRMKARDLQMERAMKSICKGC
jgi:hypothetical protein